MTDLEPYRICAVIFIPPNLSLDSLYAEECIAYVISRGYQLAAIVRDWADVDTSLIIGTAQVVIVARNEHRGNRPAEVAGEQTQIIERRNGAIGRCSVERPRNELVGAYRSGYTDGFVDCLTLRRNPPPDVR
jgi:hypothetical protein